MCLICVEYYYQRMTKNELKKALPEMVMFAKTEEERNHLKKLQSLESDEDLNEVVKQYASKSEVKNDTQASFRYTRETKSTKNR